MEVFRCSFQSGCGQEYIIFHWSWAGVLIDLVDVTYCSHDVQALREWLFKMNDGVAIKVAALSQMEYKQKMLKGLSTSEKRKTESTF